MAPIEVFTLTRPDDMAAHFAECGWVMVDAVEPAVAMQLGAWADEVAAWPEGDGEWLQHRELTDDGPVLARSENFVPFHEGLRTLLCDGPLLEVASTLLGEWAVLYKEKINYKLPGGAGFSPHQDAPAYPLIDRHVSAMVAIDAADQGNGCLEVVSGCHRDLLATDERGCIRADVVAELEWQVVEVPAGMTLWFHSRTPHRSGPNRSARPRRALYPTYNARREGDLREAYYRAKRNAFASEASGDRARVSLIGDFEGRPV